MEFELPCMLAWKRECAGRKSKLFEMQQPSIICNTSRYFYYPFGEHQSIAYKRQPLIGHKFLALSQQPFTNFSFLKKNFEKHNENKSSNGLVY